MTTRNTKKQPHILFCKCIHYETVPGTEKQQVLEALVGSGLEINVVDDLCGLAANRDPRLHSWVQTPSLAVVACFPRAVRWLFHAAGMPLPQERTQFFNMRTQPADEITRELMMDDGLLMVEEQSAPSASNHQSSIIGHQSDWVPWFPVIDYDRCVNCKQCLNFCLFGVYGLSANGRVEVQKPSGCKTNCPACARMCPQQAIIFPKYADPPINGDVGAGPRACPESEQPQEGAPAGDLYERIRRRTAGGKRFATQTDGLPTRSCPTLDRLKRELNIPDEVLASLSPAEIQRVIRQPRPQPNPGGEKKGDEPHE